ncbi:MAG TPA: PEP-CTERM sorting domain-containing protein [Vicinamibacterales bacterium]|jgi:PEP-CTERM putative exosortase interaction domain|nr:PEP-CTERM sorting domain-containing protein [Vicinamibacterales bacterium]
MTCRRPATFLVSLLGLAPCAHADPITPASFTATIAGNRPGGEIVFRIETPSTHLRLETDRSEGESASHLAILLSCTNCRPGDEFDFTGTVGTTTVGGNAFLNDTVPVAFTSSFQVASPRAVVARAVNGVSETTVPISVSGEIDYQELRFGVPPSPPTILHLAGEGHGVLRLDEANQLFPEITLFFASDPAPAPEPGTILLFGLGAAAMACRSSHRMP